MKFLFFNTHLDLIKNQNLIDEHTYPVATGEGVLIKANTEFQSVVTEGLRTCVAFALINPDNHTALLIHFYSLAQMQEGLSQMIDQFMQVTDELARGVICVIAGGREDSVHSVSMIQYAMDLVRNQLTTINPLKLRMDAPIIADYSETLSLKIDLITGESQVSLDTEKAIPSPTSVVRVPQMEENIAFEPIVFINKIQEAYLPEIYAY